MCMLGGWGGGILLITFVHTISTHSVCYFACCEHSGTFFVFFLPGKVTVHMYVHNVGAHACVCVCVCACLFVLITCHNHSRETWALISIVLIKPGITDN